MARSYLYEVASRWWVNTTIIKFINQTKLIFLRNFKLLATNINRHSKAINTDVFLRLRLGQLYYRGYTDDIIVDIRFLSVDITLIVMEFWTTKSFHRWHKPKDAYLHWRKFIVSLRSKFSISYSVDRSERLLWNNKTIRSTD